MYHGIINVYKEPGYTSFDVVAKMRGICGQKKIGHTGTLDPDAEGVLPICLGKATKVCDMLTDSDKIYRAVMRMGVRTDTLDMTGQILEERDCSDITDEMVIQTLEEFVGNIEQIPPMYSALKVNGKKLCDLARKGVTVERKARPVTIYGIKLLRMQLPEVEFEVSCSKGTYIRTLIDDIGSKLGCGAAMAHLIRIQAAGYRVEQSYRLSDLQQKKAEGRLESCIQPIDDVFADYDPCTVKEAAMKWLYNGNALSAENFIAAPDRDKPIRVYDCNGIFCGVYKYHEEQELYKPVKMFLV